MSTQTTPVADTQLLLDELARRLTAIEAKARAASRDAKARYNREMLELRHDVTGSFAYFTSLA